MKTSELLRKAADEIRRRGWWQGAMGSDRNDTENCRVCADGAMNAASTGSPWGFCSMVPRDVFKEANRIFSIWDFNDTVGRTKEEVLEAFERAALAAEADGD